MLILRKLKTVSNRAGNELGKTPQHRGTETQRRTEKNRKKVLFFFVPLCLSVERFNSIFKSFVSLLPSARRAMALSSPRRLDTNDLEME